MKVVPALTFSDRAPYNAPMKIIRMAAAAALIGFLAGMTACAQAPVKSTPDSQRLQQIDLFLDSFRRSFEEKNFQTFSSLYPEKDRTDLRSISSVWPSMDRPQLLFNVDRIVLEGEIVRVALHWDLRWNSGENEPVKQRGNAVFRLDGLSELKILEIQGENPFLALTLNNPPRS